MYTNIQFFILNAVHILPIFPCLRINDDKSNETAKEIKRDKGKRVWHAYRRSEVAVKCMTRPQVRDKFRFCHFILAITDHFGPVRPCSVEDISHLSATTGQIDAIES